jgi:class III poly(R)-hydroxyalkanoic acid synthase PhaE subunit
MSESNAWADQWFKAQQQFVNAWSDMAKPASNGGQQSQADLWAQSFDLWRKASGGNNQPDIQQAIDKCVDMGREYFAMAEQVSKSLNAGAKPVDAINQWMEQLKQSLQQFGTMPGFNGGGVNDFMKQWFAPTQSWQQMVSALMPMGQNTWQMPGMNTSVFNMGEAIDPLGKMLEAPGIGYFREPQEKQQKGIQLALEYHEANSAFNQAFMKVALESIQDYQMRLLKMDREQVPKTLRQLYDLWVEISEEHYAEFAMSDEYQTLYGDMVNRLMILKKHYAQITDDTLRAMNLPNTTEVDTMQQRLQQLRRENIVLKKEIGEIKAMLQRSAPAAAAPKTAAQPAPAPKKVAPKPAVKKAAVKQSATPKAAAAPKAAVKKTPAKKKPAATKVNKGA